jgi:hypothetical protein
VQRLRLEALKRNTSVALRFDPVIVGEMRGYVDGDADGVLQRDIDAGIDLPLAPTARLEDRFAGVRLQIASAVPDPDGGGGTLAAGSDPVRIGSSNFVTLSPAGSMTSGTIYLSSPGGPQMCVRFVGATGRLRVLRFDTVTRTWRQD